MDFGHVEYMGAWGIGECKIKSFKGEVQGKDLGILQINCRGVQGWERHDAIVARGVTHRNSLSMDCHS